MKKIDTPLIMEYVEFNKGKEISYISKSSKIKAYNSDKYLVLPFYKDVTRLI